MTSRDRVVLVVLLAVGGGALVVLLVLAGQLCPAPAPGDPCPDADRNRAIVVGFAAAGVALLVAPIAFVAEYRVRHRIVYRGAWGRALRRAAWCGLALAAVGALRLADALNPFSIVVVIVVAVAAEWLAMRRLDET